MIPSLLSISLIYGCIPSMDCMIPSLLSISLIYGCIPSMDWLDGLHDTESSLHIVDLWLHTLDGLHLLTTSTSGCPSSSLLRILAVRAFWMFLMAAVLATAASPSS